MWMRRFFLLGMSLVVGLDARASLILDEEPGPVVIAEDAPSLPTISEPDAKKSVEPKPVSPPLAEPAKIDAIVAPVPVATVPKANGTLPKAKADSMPASVKATPVMSADSADVITDQESMTANIEIVHRLPAQTRHGEPMNNEIVVRNIGKSPAQDVVVMITLTSNAELLESVPTLTSAGGMLRHEVGQLGAGEERVVQLKLLPTSSQDQPNAMVSVSVQMRSTMAKKTIIVRPEVTLAVTGPSTGTLGELLVYTIELANTGNAPATNLMLKDLLPPGLSHPQIQGRELDQKIPSLAPGEKKTIPLKLTVTQAGSMVNTISIVGDGVERIEKVLPIEVEDLKITLETVVPKIRYLGKSCPVEFKVTNKGKTKIREGKLVTSLPDGLTFVSTTAEGMLSESGGSVEWNIASIEPGETKSFQMMTTAARVGDYAGSAMVLAAGKTRQENRWTTKVDGILALQVDVTDEDDPVEVKNDTVYVIRVANQGTMSASNIKVDIVVPNELQPIAAEGPVGQRVANNVVSFDPVPALTPKSDLTFRLKVKALKVGDHRVRVNVTCDQIRRSIAKEENTTVFGDEPAGN